MRKWYIKIRRYEKERKGNEVWIMAFNMGIEKKELSNGTGLKGKQRIP